MLYRREGDDMHYVIKLKYKNFNFCIFVKTECKKECNKIMEAIEFDSHWEKCN